MYIQIVIELYVLYMYITIKKHIFKGKKKKEKLSAVKKYIGLCLCCFRWMMI